MDILTRQSLANIAAHRWAMQYRDGNTQWHIDVTARLAALGDQPNPDDVDAAIGNKSWTNPGTCSECERESPVIVQVGEEPHYESRTANLCPECLREALELCEAALEWQHQAEGSKIVTANESAR